MEFKRETGILKVVETFTSDRCIFTRFESPLMSPRKSFKVKLHIRKIKRGKPSVCDELECAE